MVSLTFPVGVRVLVKHDLRSLIGIEIRGVSGYSHWQDILS